MRVLKLESSDEWLCLLESVKGLSHGSNTFYVMREQTEDSYIYTAIGAELTFSCSTKGKPQEFEKHIQGYGFMVFKGKGFLQ